MIDARAILQKFPSSFNCECGQCWTLHLVLGGYVSDRNWGFRKTEDGVTVVSMCPRCLFQHIEVPKMSIQAKGMPEISLTDEEAKKMCGVMVEMMSAGAMLCAHVDNVLKLASPHPFLIPMRQSKEAFEQSVKHMFSEAYGSLGHYANFSGGADSAGQN